MLINLLHHRNYFWSIDHSYWGWDWSN